MADIIVHFCTSLHSKFQICDWLKLTSAERRLVRMQADVNFSQSWIWNLEWSEVQKFTIISAIEATVFGQLFLRKNADSASFRIKIVYSYTRDCENSVCEQLMSWNLFWTLSSKYTHCARFCLLNEGDVRGDGGRGAIDLYRFFLNTSERSRTPFEKYFVTTRIRPMDNDVLCILVLSYALH